MPILDDILKPITGMTGSGLLKSLGTSESVRDFQHGNRLFVTNGYQLAPKRQYLYHVQIRQRYNAGQVAFFIEP